MTTPTPDTPAELAEEIMRMADVLAYVHETTVRKNHHGPRCRTELHAVIYLLRDLATLAASSTAPDGVVAWLHADGDRVITATQKAQAIKDGGASASSVKPYSVPLAAGSTASGGWKPGQPITEAMHVAACKVLARANGLDGTPQRMIDAMLTAAPAAAARKPLADERVLDWVLPGSVRAQGGLACLLWAVRQTERAHGITAAHDGTTEGGAP